MDLCRIARKVTLWLVASVAALMSCVAISAAQEIIGTPGAPDANDCAGATGSDCAGVR